MQVTKIYKVLSFAAGIFFSGSLFAQERKIELPLSSNKIESVHIDSRGLVWLGTEEGLNVYNRKTVNSFYSNIVDSASLLNSEIYRFQQLSGDTVLAFSKNGINVFNPSANGQGRFNVPSCSTPCKHNLCLTVSWHFVPAYGNQ